MLQCESVARARSGGTDLPFSSNPILGLRHTHVGAAARDDVESVMRGRAAFTTTPAFVSRDIPRNPFPPLYAYAPLMNWSCPPSHYLTNTRRLPQACPVNPFARRLPDRNHAIVLHDAMRQFGVSTVPQSTPMIVDPETCTFLRSRGEASHLETIEGPPLMLPGYFPRLVELPQANRTYISVSRRETFIGESSSSRRPLGIVADPICNT